jgi:hypothetical protein
MSVTETQPERRFILPADYYSSASPQPILPSWVKFGCGGLALLALLVMFAGGAWLASGGMIDFMDLVLGMSLGEMRPMYQSDVTEADKNELEKEFETLRENVRNHSVAIQQLDPVLQAMRRATGDAKVTREEVREMTAAARQARAVKRARPPK